MSADIRLTVDPVACTGHGLCAGWLPERIELDEWGYPVLDSTPLSPELVKLARRAAGECPVRALRLARILSTENWGAPPSARGRLTSRQ